MTPMLAGFNNSIQATMAAPNWVSGTLPPTMEHPSRQATVLTLQLHSGDICSTTQDIRLVYDVVALTGMSTIVLQFKPRNHGGE